MAILFLDDDKARQKTFRARHPSVNLVDTAAECIEALKAGSWRAVFLDHDLGGEQFVSSDREDCGMEVVRWLEQNETNIDYIICHSLNPAGRTQMVLALRQAGYNVYDIPISAIYSSSLLEIVLDEEKRETDADGS